MSKRERSASASDQEEGVVTDVDPMRHSRMNLIKSIQVDFDTAMANSIEENLQRIAPDDEKLRSYAQDFANVLKSVIIRQIEAKLFLVSTEADGDEDEDEPLDRDLAVEVHNLEKQVSELSKRYNMARIALRQTLPNALKEFYAKRFEALSSASEDDLDSSALVAVASHNSTSVALVSTLMGSESPVSGRNSRSSFNNASTAVVSAEKDMSNDETGESIFSTIVHSREILLSHADSIIDNFTKSSKRLQTLNGGLEMTCATIEVQEALRSQEAQHSFLFEGNNVSRLLPSQNVGNGSDVRALLSQRPSVQSLSQPLASSSLPALPVSRVQPPSSAEYLPNHVTSVFAGAFSQSEFIVSSQQLGSQLETVGSDASIDDARSQTNVEMGQQSAFMHESTQRPRQVELLDTSSESLHVHIQDIEVAGEPGTGIAATANNSVNPLSDVAKELDALQEQITGHYNPHHVEGSEPGANADATSLPRKSIIPPPPKQTPLPTLSFSLQDPVVTNAMRRSIVPGKFK